MPTAELIDRFRYHPARTTERAGEHERVRAICVDVALTLDALVPFGREKTLALTKLEEVMFWANAGIARQED